MAKILFAHPLFLSRDAAESEAASPYFPLGILYLAAYARSQGHDVAVFDGTFEDGVSSFTSRLETEQPDVVGIAALAPTRSDALLLARLASDTGAFVILGGPDPTTNPDIYLADQSVDLVVHHEGEATIASVLDLFDQDRLDGLTLSAEPGIAYRIGDKTVVNEPRAPIEDLDELPLPARDLIDMSRYLDAWEESAGYSSITISTSRGCPYGCQWCEESVHGPAFRQRSPASVASEVAAIKDEYNVGRLRVIDDVDGIDREWIEAWADAAASAGAVVPFEALNDLSRHDIPMLDVRDSL